jgi:glucose-6-phosphate 1-dehydrogenase
LRDEKVKVLDAIRVPAVETVQTCSSLGQYTGYQDEPEVSPNSRSPTYAALRLNIDNWRWQGIPFYLRSGKGMTAKTSEVIIQFLCPPHMIFTVPKGETIRCNRLVVTLQPDEGIHLAFQTKLPDQGMTLKESNLYFHYRDSYPVTPIPDAYETLLLDVLEGDASLFIRNDEIELAWRVIDPIIAGWEARTREPLPEYEVGSWGPPQADAFMRNDGRGWVSPRGRSRPGTGRAAHRKRRRRRRGARQLSRVLGRRLDAPRGVFALGGTSRAGYCLGEDARLFRDRPLCPLACTQDSGCFVGHRDPTLRQTFDQN